jgi:formate hydrogenlyase subunit 4
MAVKITGIVLILLMPFVFAGVINRVKAFWAGRKGPPILQPLFDFVKYMGKAEVVSRLTTPLFILAPVVSFTAVVAASMLVPLISGARMVSFDGDFILFAYLLALSKFVSLAASMETGSSFEGMGSAREAAFTAIAEPAYFIIMATACAVSGAASFDSISGFVSSGGPRGLLLAMLSAAGLFIMLITEGSRVPVDDPNTHLELTMIHEAMVLDNSGPSMAFISYSANLKMTLLAALIAGFLMPAGLGAVLSGIILAAGIVLTAVITGCMESLMARLRMTHVPQFVFYMISLAFILFCAAFVFMTGGAK